MENKKIIEVKNLSLVINDKKLFSNVSFDVNEKEIIGVAGPNGSGKTSLVRMILGFNSCKYGSIIHHREELYGYIPQYFQSINSLNITVLEFLKLTDIKNVSLEESIKITKIDKLLKSDLNNLSGGELRRVLMAKALLFSKNCLFLDEPTCWLDKDAQREFYDLIARLNELLSCAIVLISHDPFFREGFFSKVIKL